MVFCNTRKNTDFVVKNLKANKINAIAIHGGLSQNKRTRTIDLFDNAKVSVLVCTDVAARGLDIEGITHIINYDVPMDAPVYFHRIGRTARNGGEGTAITLVGYGEIPDLNKIKTLTNTNIEELEPLNPQYC